MSFHFGGFLSRIFADKTLHILTRNTQQITHKLKAIQNHFQKLVKYLALEILGRGGLRNSNLKQKYTSCKHKKDKVKTHSKTKKRQKANDGDDKDRAQKEVGH